MEVTGYYRPDAGQGVVLRTVLTVPQGTRFTVSVQAEANRDHHIVRGQPIPGTSLHGEFVVNLGGVPVTGQRIRDDTIDWREHLRRFSPRVGTGSLMGFVGAGNLTMNPEFIGFSRGTTYYVAGQRFDHLLPCLLSGPEGARFDRVRISPEAPPPADGISGPQLVRAGKPLTLGRLARMASEGEFYDLRHVIQFPHIAWGAQGARKRALPSVDVGLERFWRDGMLDPQAVAAAVRGEPVEIALEPYVEVFPPAGEPIGVDRLRATLDTQGYIQVTRPRARGEWRLAQDRIEVVFYLGIYNHSVLGVGADAALRWLGFSSQGGRTGLTLLDTAQLAADYMTDAILVDNGGDVMCRLDDSWLLPSPYGRERIRGLLLLEGDRRSVHHETHSLETIPLTRQCPS